MENEVNIPKRIFYVWCGGKQPVDVEICRQTWKLAMPNFTLVEINEQEGDYFCLQNELEKSAWLRTAYKHKIWAFVADYARICVLFNHGGIYLDSDISAVRSLEPLLSKQFFAGFYENRVAGGVIGSIKLHEYTGELLEFYRNHMNEYNFKTITQYLSEIILQKSGNFRCETENLQLAEKNIIYSEKYFYPLKLGATYSDTLLTPTTYTIHWWKGSWRDNIDLNKLLHMNV